MLGIFLSWKLANAPNKGVFCFILFSFLALYSFNLGAQKQRQFIRYNRCIRALGFILTNGLRPATRGLNLLLAQTSESVGKEKLKLPQNFEIIKILWSSHREEEGAQMNELSLCRIIFHLSLEEISQSLGLGSMVVVRYQQEMKQMEYEVLGYPQ